MKVFFPFNQTTESDPENNRLFKAFNIEVFPLPTYPMITTNTPYSIFISIFFNTYLIFGSNLTLFPFPYFL